MRTLIVLAVLAGIGISAYLGYWRHPEPIAARKTEGLFQPAPAAPARSLEERAAAAQGTTYPEQRPDPPPRAAPAESAAGFRCDGRQHCSQMRSCEEARFFVQNCSLTKMDGDRDGKPCEDWCGH